MNKHKRHPRTSLFSVGFEIPNIVKLILLSLLITSSVMANALNSRYVNVELILNKTTVANVISSINEQTGYEFSYDESILNREILATNLNAKNERIETVLNKVLDGTDISYKVVNNRVFLKDNRKSEALPVKTGIQQQKKITGLVKDASGMEVIGANVFVKGTTNGVVTDLDGNFTLLNVPEDATIVVSYIGYLEQELKVAGNTVFNILLKEDTQKIEEVVIVGYGVQKKVNMTGSISAIKADDLSNISTSNLSNTLAGRAPGVNVTGNSGMIGSGSAIRIRGGFDDPLFVIDGIVRDKDAFNALEANEIDQLSFLKDAATAAIYGSRAGNGVVLVTTKGGVAQKPVFNYQGSYTFMNPTMELLSDKTTATDELIYQNRVSEFQGIALPNGEKEFEYFKDKNYNVNDYIWQTPWNQKHSFSVSGGSETVTYYALASYIGEEGSYKNLSNDKFNLRSNVTAKITNDIKMNFNLSANQQNHDRFYWPFSDDDEFTIGDLYRCTFNWPKTYPFYLEKDGTPANHVTDYSVQTPMGSWQAWSVVDQVIGDRYIKTRKREMNAILSFDIDLKSILPGLTTRFVGNYIGNDYMRKKYMTFQKNYVWSPANADENRYIPAPPDPNNVNIFTFSKNQESLEYKVNSLWAEQLNWFLNYNNTFGKHAVSATAVWEQAASGGEKIEVRGEQPLTDFDQMFVYSEDAERRFGTAKEETAGRLSWIGRANYSYDQKYIAEFSFRYDGNTLFPKEKRWGFFPSFSAAWRINKENFMSSTSGWLDDLKIRASYGTTGNDLNVLNRKITPFSYMRVYKPGEKYIYGNSLNLGIKPGDTPNPFLTWATSTTYNGGFDFTVLDSRFTGSVDAFYKKETDILGSRLVTIPDTYGQELAPENYAARSWRGIELNAMWRDKAFDGKINYSVYGNMGYSTDKWDVYDESSLYAPGGALADQAKAGHPIERIIGYKTLGMVRTQEQLDELLAKGFKQFGRDPYLGALIFEDVRGAGYSSGGDGKIDENDKQVLSDKATPRINYGFGGSVSWKGFSLDLHFQGVAMYERIIGNLQVKDGDGYIVYKNEGIRQYGGAIRPYYPIWAGDVWTPENPDAKYPRPVGRSWEESGTGASSYWVKNGAYIRLKNLNLGYNLPNKVLKPLGLTYAQLFFNATNLFVISPMTEFHDPEQDCYDSYPLMKSFTFGLDIRF